MYRNIVAFLILTTLTISVLAQNINYVYPKNGVNNTDSIEFLWNKITTPEIPYSSQYG